MRATWIHESVESRLQLQMREVIQRSGIRRGQKGQFDNFLQTLPGAAGSDGNCRDVTVSQLTRVKTR